MTDVQRLRLLTGVVTLVLSFVIVSGIAYGLLLWRLPPEPVRINVRWVQGLDALQRVELERRFHLTAGELREGTTWQYTLTLPTTDVIRAIVQYPRVEDTANVDRRLLRPLRDGDPRALRYAVAAGNVGAAIVAIFWALASARPNRTTSAKSDVSSPQTRPQHRQSANLFGDRWSQTQSRSPEVRAYEAIAVAVLLVYLFGSVLQPFVRSERSAFFGISQIGPLGWLGLLTAAGWRRIIRRGRADAVAWLFRDSRGVPARIAIAIAFGVVFFALRTHFINPDGSALAGKFAEDIPIRGAHVTHDEMLELWLHSKVWILTNRQLGWSVEYSYQVVSCTAGAIFVFMLLTYWQQALSDWSPWAFGLCMSAGYIQLFFGDVENYTVTAAWVMAYLLAALLFLKGNWSVLPASFLLAIAMMFHLESGFLAPSLLYLLAVAWRRGARAKAVCAAVGACLIVVGTLWFFDEHGLPIRLLFYDSHAFGHGGHWGQMLVTPSADYYFRLASLATLLAPAAALLFPLVLFRRLPLDSINVHLLLASGFMALFVVSWRADLGIYNDWNLFAIAAIPVTLLVSRNVFESDGLKSTPGVVAALTLLFLVHSATWIVSNHSL